MSVQVVPGEQSSLPSQVVPEGVVPQGFTRQGLGVGVGRGTFQVNVGPFCGQPQVIVWPVGHPQVIVMFS